MGNTIIKGEKICQFVKHTSPTKRICKYEKHLSYHQVDRIHFILCFNDKLFICLFITFACFCLQCNWACLWLIEKYTLLTPHSHSHFILFYHRQARLIVLPISRSFFLASIWQFGNWMILKKGGSKVRVLGQEGACNSAPNGPNNLKFCMQGAFVCYY